MTKDDTLKILHLIEKVYPLVTMKSETVLKWMARCESMDYSIFFKKLSVHLRKQPYPPTLEELIGKSNNEGGNLEWLAEYSLKG